MPRADRRLACAALAIVAPASAAAQQIDDVVVTGRGLPDLPGDRAFDIITIDRARIEANASGRLESVLADVAGLQQFRRSDSRSANPTSQGITLRGLGGNAASRALLIQDGVPQADPFGGWVPFPAYATDRIDRIRVTRGGGSGFWGPGALAGTVEIDSATPTEAAPLYAAFAYGSRDSVDARGSAALVRPGGFATLSAAYARGDGFVPIVAERRGPIDRPAPYEQASLAARTVIDVAAATELQASVGGFTDRRERGTPFTANRSDGLDASLRLVGRGAWRWSALGYLQTRDFASDFASIDAARTTATRTLSQYRTPATGWGARVEVAPPLGAGSSLRFGGDVRGVRGRTEELYSFVAGTPTRRREAGGANLTYGAFIDGTGTIGPVTLTLGGRVDGWRIGDGSLGERALAGGPALTALAFPTRRGSEWTGRAGAAWQVAAPLSLRAAAYRGWRLPTLNELYRPFRLGTDATAPDPALKPESVRGVEAGATLTPTRRSTLAVTWFRNRLDDAIANITRGRGPGTFPLVGFVAAGGAYRVRGNLDAITVDGIEVDGSWRVGAVGVAGSWSHLNPRVRASGAAAALDGTRPAQTPRDQVSATLDWRRGVRAAAVTLRHVGRQFDDDANSRSLAPATTADAFVTWPLVDALSLEARAENLFDARVEAAITGVDVIERATPRTLWIGLRYRPR